MFDAGELPLSYESYSKLLKPFPERGQMDVIKDGQDDEGMLVEEDKAAGEFAWDDACDMVSPGISDAEMGRTQAPW